jgi:hypothetical protein
MADGGSVSDSTYRAAKRLGTARMQATKTTAAISLKSGLPHPDSTYRTIPPTKSNFIVNTVCDVIDHALGEQKCNGEVPRLILDSLIPST